MDLQVDSGGGPLKEAHVEELARAVEDVTGRVLREVGLRVSDDATVALLNERYAGESKPTDVLSFPLEDYAGGDIVISLPAAASQAEAAGWGLLSELQLLATHGMLHLVGRDHHTKQERDQMERDTVQVLEAVGVAARPYL